MSEKIAANLFGQVAKPAPLDEGFSINPLELQMPLRHGGVMRCCCQGCGEFFEIEQAGAAMLAQLADIELPADLAQHYFQVEACEVCGDYRGATLHQVPGKI